MITVLDAGVRDRGGALDYAYFRLATAEGERWRCVPLWELRYIPIESREEPDVLGKTWSAMRGMHNAGIDFVYVAAGIFKPDHIGVSQMYGVACEAAGEEAAAEAARAAMDAVRAIMANFLQSRLLPADADRVKWLIEFIATRRRVLACLGHPDPRQTKRGLGSEGKMSDPDDDLALQQNEILFRGLAKLRENFAFVVNADRIARGSLVEGLVRVAEEAAKFASRRKGSIGIGVSLGVPIMTGIANAVAGTHSAGQAQAHTVSDGVSQSDGRAHTDSWAHTDSHSVGVGQSESWGESHAQGVSHSQGVSEAVSDSVGHSVGQGWSHTDSQSEGWGETNGQSWGHTAGHSVGSSWGHAEMSGVSHSNNFSASQSQSNGVTVGSSNGTGTSQTETEGSSSNVGGGVQIHPNDLPVVGGLLPDGIDPSVSISAGESQSSSSSSSQNHSDSVAVNSGASHGVSVGYSDGWSSGVSDFVGGSESFSSSDSVGGSHSLSHSNSIGSADSVSGSLSDSESHGVSQGVSESWGESESWGQSHSTGVSKTEGWGTADTVGGADSVSHAEGRSHTEGQGQAITQGQGGGQAFTGGFSTGITPGLNISRSFQTEDDVADRVTEDLRRVEALLNQAASEGGFMTDAYLFVDSPGAEQAAAALVPQAFHGPVVPQPILTQAIAGDDLSIVRHHALAFRPCRSLDDGDPFGGLLWRRYGTLLTAGMLAAYAAPGLFEEGPATTTQERLPALAFYPTMPGEVVVGHQYSPETYELTDAPVRLDRGRYFHTAFCGDTGFGKSVAAIRMAYETTLKWKLRTVVLDFGAGWRSLLNAPGLDGHCNIYQLQPGGARPFRWNPLQIGTHIDPETQWRQFTDIFAALSQLGVKRQTGEMRNALKRVYVAAGVLVNDPAVQGDPEWGVVRPLEEVLANAPAGTLITTLPRSGRQKLAVHRSKQCDLSDLYADISRELRAVPARDTMLRGVLEGILIRLDPLVQGAASQQYAKGEGCVELSDIAAPWGVVILEGGAMMDAFSKAFLLAFAAWHIYTDAVTRRRPGDYGGADDYMQIIFEEANKILGGLSGGGNGEDGPSAAEYVADLFANMWRDSRKYRMWLHIITQSPSLIPPGILSSCNNLIVNQLKNAKDRDLVVAALARSEKGLLDVQYSRLIARLPIGQAIAKFGYAFDSADVEPFLMRPRLLKAAEPSDEDILRILG